MEVDKYRIQGKILTYNNESTIDMVPLNSERNGDEITATVSGTATGGAAGLKAGNPGNTYTDLEINPIRMVHFKSDVTCFVSIKWSGSQKDLQAVVDGNYLMEIPTTFASSPPVGQGSNPDFGITELFITGLNNVAPQQGGRCHWIMVGEGTT